MSVNRESLVIEPSRVVFAGASVYSQDVISVELGTETFDLLTDAHGKLDERVSDFTCKARFTPDGRFSAAIIAAFWPHANAAVGSPLFTNTDRPCAFHKRSGGLATMITAAVTRMPPITFSAIKTLIGQVELTGLRGNGMDPDDANSLFTNVGGGGTFADASFTGPAQIKTQPYRAAWAGVTGFDDFETEDGFTFETDLQVQARTIDSVGVINLYFRSLAAMVRCKPVESTMDNIIAALKVQGTGVARGQSAGLSGELTITGADGVTYLTIPAAGLKTAGFRFGSMELQNGEIGFFAKRTFSGGAAQPLFTLAAS